MSQENNQKNWNNMNDTQKILLKNKKLLFY